MLLSVIYGSKLSNQLRLPYNRYYSKGAELYFNNIYYM